MKYIVQVELTVSAKNTDVARSKAVALLKEKGVRGANVGGLRAISPDLPELSDELRTFIRKEIDNNDEDTSGYETTLATVHGNLFQMPADLLADEVGALTIGGNEEEFHAKLTEELNALILVCGDQYIAAHVLGDE